MKLPVSATAGLRPHPSNWTKEPEKANTHCLYCKQPVPNHAEDCIVPDRTVVVELKIRMVVRMPQSFDVDSINFAMNGSSACSQRYIDQLYKEGHQEENLCSVCHRMEMEYMREATQEDHEQYHYIDEVSD